MLWHTGENQMRDGLILAFQFFSRIPINKEVEFDENNIRFSIVFYPLIGAIIGILSGLVYYILFEFNTNIASLGAIFMILFLTGGIHIDGLSDTFDGFLSGRDRERTLEIMKDSRVGTFGAISIIMLLLSKYVIISSFVHYLPLALTLSMVNSRIVLIRIISTKKIARPGGLGDMFNKSNPGKYVLYSWTAYIAILLIINIAYIIPLIITIIFGEMFSAWSYKKVGGMTGDTYGAIVEIGESISLLAYLGVLTWIF